MLKRAYLIPKIDYIDRQLHQKNIEIVILRIISQGYYDFRNVFLRVTSLFTIEPSPCHTLLWYWPIQHLHVPLTFWMSLARPIPGVTKKCTDSTISYLPKYWIWRIQIFYSNLASVDILYWKIWYDYLIPLKFWWYLKISEFWAPYWYWKLQAR